jgi:hypothetical protein
LLAFFLFFVFRSKDAILLPVRQFLFVALLVFLVGARFFLQKMEYLALREGRLTESRR